MRGLVLALALLAPTLAHADNVTYEDVHLRGWTDSGGAVIEVRDGFHVMSELGSVAGDDTWAVCMPQPIGTEQPAGDSVCTVCKDAASCGLTSVVKHAKPAKISPDHKIRVKDKKVCTGKGDAKTCSRVVTLGKLDTLTHPQDVNRDKMNAARVYWRPDSGAVMVVFEDMMPGFEEGMPPIPHDVLYFVELTAAAGRGTGDGREYGSGSGSGGTASSGSSKHDGYAFVLEHVKKNASGTAGEADLILQVTSGGNTTETQIDHLTLSQQGMYGMGDLVTVDRTTGKVTLGGDSVPAEKAIMKNLPADTVAAAGFVYDGERAFNKIVIVAAVQDTHGVSVVEQKWVDAGDEPDDTSTIKIP